MICPSVRKAPLGGPGPAPSNGIEAIRASASPAFTNLVAVLKGKLLLIVREKARRDNKLYHPSQSDRVGKRWTLTFYVTVLSKNGEADSQIIIRGVRDSEIHPLRRDPEMHLLKQVSRSISKCIAKTC